jgi:hypothetical protein
MNCAALRSNVAALLGLQWRNWSGILQQLLRRLRHRLLRQPNQRRQQDRQDRLAKQ